MSLYWESEKSSVCVLWIEFLVRMENNTGHRILKVLVTDRVISFAELSWGVINVIS